MKKISLGSFPLVDVRGSDRKVFESYLIKVVSDLITVNQISNSIHADRVRYITPISIMNFIKENKSDQLTQPGQQPNNNQNSDIRDQKANSIKNAFRNTKTLYQSMANDPFYKTNIFYPIYMEEAIKNNLGYSDYNYDFLILANDLIKQQLLDEIQYDDRITLLFLVLKCLLVPNLKINQVGLDNIPDGANFRKYFSIFLETCKNENINPFDMFIKLIKAAGKQKRKGLGGTLAKLGNRLTNKDNSVGYHSTSFVNLFNTEGEIKDAKFLLDISLNKINAFVEEDPKMDPNYNPMLRQYSQAKTHEYGKILSIIDALRAFNQSNEVVTNLTPSQNLTPIKVGEDTLLLNLDGLINELETTYFRRFLEDFKDKESKALETIRNSILTKFKIDLYSENGTFEGLETVDSINKRIATLQTNFNMAKREYSSLVEKATRFANALGFNTFNNIDPNQLDQSQLNIYQSNQSLLNQQINNINTYNEELSNLSSSKLNAPTKDQLGQVIKDKKYSLMVNLEILQSQLTALYSEIYQYFYSEDFRTDIGTIKAFGKFDSQTLEPILFGSPKSQYLNQLKMTIEEISGSFINEFSINIQSEITTRFPNYNLSQINSIINKELINYISIDTIKKNLITNIFTPVFIKYSNKAISESNQLKDLKSDNNPLLKRILNEKNLFKAYILTSEVLVQAYELIHYIDTIKYEEGLINHPVSKVFNNVNKIQFMIKRLGLDNHPVYIFHNEHVMLSMPGYLSLTGIPFISSVKTEEFMKFGKINWSQDLWSQEHMFGGIHNSKKYKDIKANVARIQDEIKKASEDVKNAQGKEKAKKEQALKNKQAELKKQQDKLEEFKKLSSGSNLSSNLNMEKRSDISYPTNQQSYPTPSIRPGGNYDHGMNRSGLNRYEQNQLNTGINKMDGLQNQNFQRPTENNQHDNQLGDHQTNNDFMNNPYIQNRINTINHN